MDKYPTDIVIGVIILFIFMIIIRSRLQRPSYVLPSTTNSNTPTLRVSGSGKVTVSQDIVRISVNVLNKEGDNDNLNQKVDRIKKILDSYSSVSDVEISYENEKYYDSDLKKQVFGNLIAKISFQTNEIDLSSIQPKILIDNVVIKNTTFMISRKVQLEAENTAITLATQNAINKGKSAIKVINDNSNDDIEYKINDVSINSNNNHYPVMMRASYESSDMKSDSVPANISGGEHEISVNVMIQMKI